ncbi:hypothetical protein [Halobacterium litoreum]|uniref:Matrixin n=1 Tax=Halobacterium litoreum TaxID=2039234 RepID=A0ABD5NFT3_9EURY|nr:hypothetical protein [Halobacterium litoreum]UHH12990.1 hypothetical protein LT972_12610 [Halobacterium litoreum]
MARHAVALALLALVVLSGCLTANPTSGERSEAPAAELPHDDRSVSNPPYGAYDNPWRTDEITVVVKDAAGMERNVAPDVMKTLQYWEETAGRDAAYRPNYRLRSEADDPDIRVVLVRTVEGCGVHGDRVALGCAPVLDADDTVDDTVTIRVRAGHSSATTREILKHEFGHTLGYRHGDGLGVMSEELSTRAPVDVVNASAREYPWASEQLAVAVTSAEGGVTDAQRARVRSALEYYQRGAGGAVPRPPSFSLVDDPSTADVVVSLTDDVDGCPVVGPSESCVEWQGPSVDDDPKPEYYTGARIVVGASGHDRPGWHLGYWLGHSLWTDGYPKPFQTGPGDEKPAATTW